MGRRAAPSRGVTRASRPPAYEARVTHHMGSSEASLGILLSTRVLLRRSWPAGGNGGWAGGRAG